MSPRYGLISALILAATVTTTGCSESRDSVSDLPESNASEFRQQLEQPGLVLAKFGAPWCPPCREVDRELAEMVATSDSQAEIIMINVDDEPGLAQEYQISSIPRLMLFQDGNRVKDHVGYAGRDEIQSWIRAATGSAKVSEVQTNPLVDS